MFGIFKNGFMATFWLLVQSGIAVGSVVLMIAGAFVCIALFITICLGAIYTGEWLFDFVADYFGLFQNRGN